MIQVIKTTTLGEGIKFNPTSKKLEVNIDGTTIVKDAAGKLGIDTDALGIKVVSDNAGNLISLGDDTGAFINADTIQGLVGEMVLADGDGIEYDAIAKALKATITAMAVTDSDTVDLTLTDTDSEQAIKADVKISTTVGNKLTKDATGLLASPATGSNAVDQTALTMTMTVDGVAGNPIALEEVQDTEGGTLFYAIKKV